MTVKVPTNGNPLVRELFQTINDRGLMFQHVCERAGLDHQTVRRWKLRGPKLENFEAMLGALELKLVIVIQPKADR